MVLFFTVVTFPPESNDDVLLLFLRGLPLLDSSPCMASMAAKKMTYFSEDALVGDILSFKILVVFCSGRQIVCVCCSLIASVFHAQMCFSYLSSLLRVSHLNVI